MSELDCYNCYDTVPPQELVTQCGHIFCARCIRKHLNNLVRLQRKQPLGCPLCHSFLDPSICIRIAEPDPVLWNTLQSYISSGQNRQKRLDLLQPLVKWHTNNQQLIPTCPPSSTGSSSRTLTTKPYTTAAGAIACTIRNTATIGCWVCYDYFRAIEGFVSTECRHAICPPCIRRYLFKCVQEDVEFPLLCPLCVVPMDILLCLKLAVPNPVLKQAVVGYFNKHGFNATKHLQHLEDEQRENAYSNMKEYHTNAEDTFKMSPLTVSTALSDTESSSTSSISSLTNLENRMDALQLEESLTTRDKLGNSTDPTQNRTLSTETASTVATASQLRSTQCPICFSCVTPMKTFVTTNCGHIFCSSCMRNWLKVTAKEGKVYPPQCGVCRGELDIRMCETFAENDAELKECLRTYISLNEHHRRLTECPILSWLS